MTSQGNGNTIAGNTNVARIFDVSSDATQFNLNDVTLSGGGSLSLNGGAIRAGSGTDIQIIDSVLTVNRGSNGGAIFTNGMITLNNSEVIGNVTTADGGGIQAGTVIVTDSTVSGNTAGADGGGINAVTATLTNSTVSGNSILQRYERSPRGGGINAVTVTLTNSTVSGNLRSLGFVNACEN